ncbi:hypothetical protein LCGC14_2626090, partial [marine sediment metagenome]
TWQSFKDVYPKYEHGVLIKIIPDQTKDWGDFKVKDKIFYGYVFKNSYYIYVVYEVMSGDGYGWKVLKDFDKDEVYWYYRSEFTGEWDEHNSAGY